MAQVQGPGLGIYGDVYDTNSGELKTAQGPGLNHHGDFYNSETKRLENKDDVKGASSSRSKSDSGGGSGFDASDFANSLGYGSTGEAKRALGISSLEEYAKDNRDRLRSRAKDASGMFDPIFSELDRQLGSLPGRQTQFQNQISSSATDQLSDVERERTRATTALENEKASGLRSLEEDIRNQLKAAGTLIGVAGAGSSSAVQGASEAISRVSQKTRGDITQNIAGKLNEINTLASNQRSQINQWKGDKIFEVTQYFANQMDQLSLQKANAGKDKQQFLSDLEFQIEQDYIGRLRQLEDQVLGYNQTVDMWERNRAAELQDFSMRQSGSVSSGVKGVQESLALFNELTSNGLSDDEAIAWMTAQGVYTLPDGVESQRAATPEDIFGAVNTTQIPQLPFDQGVSGDVQIPAGTQIYSDPFEGLGI